jgi:hypothetical protein
MWVFGGHGSGINLPNSLTVDDEAGRCASLSTFR